MSFNQFLFENFWQVKMAKRIKLGNEEEEPFAVLSTNVIRCDEKQKQAV